jgi:hypothetical protein
VLDDQGAPHGKFSAAGDQSLDTKNRILRLWVGRRKFELETLLITN